MQTDTLPSLILALATMLAYLASGVALAMGYYHASTRIKQIGVALVAAAVVGHALVLWMQMNTHAGWDVNFANALSLAALIIVILIAAWSMFRARMLEAGILAFPGAGACVALQWALPVPPLVLSHLSTMLEIHVFSSLLAYGLLSIAAINAVLLALQDYLIRHPRPLQQLELLPPLAVLEAIMFQLIAIGWLVLTLSLLSGLVFIDDLLAQHLVHKTVLSTLSWLLFGLLLLGRWWLGWRGRRAVNWTFVAMAFLALSYFGSKLVLEVVLDRSWSEPGVPTISSPAPND